MSTFTSPPVPVPGSRHLPKAGSWATGARLLIGAYFVVMSGVNLFVVLPKAEQAYRDIADTLAWPGVDRVMTDLVVPHAGPAVVVLAFLELGVGLLVLAGGRWARWGLWLAIAFMLGLFCVVSAYALANLPFVALALWLLGREHDRTPVDLVSRR